MQEDCLHEQLQKWQTKGTAEPETMPTGFQNTQWSCLRITECPKHSPEMLVDCWVTNLPLEVILIRRILNYSLQCMRIAEFLNEALEITLYS